MPDFPHLPLPQRVERRNYTGKQVPRKPLLRTIQNLKNKPRHSNNLRASVINLSAAWFEEYQKLAETPLEQFIDPRIIPIFLQVDIKTMNLDALRGFGIEIISQEEDGFIIGASVDSFNKLQDKINGFESGAAVGTAYLWEIDNGTGWKRNYILSAELNEKLDFLSDEDILDLDISIACNIHVGIKPIQKENESSRRYEKRLGRWQTAALYRDDVFSARYEQFSNIINIYGEIKSAFDFNDSFGVRAVIRVKGIKDLLKTYPYIFEIAEHDTLEGLFENSDEGADSQVVITAPDREAPKVCVIDSGIMEGHRLLAPAIDSAHSKSYVPGETVADLVGGGGHGTRVAGAVLYPTGISGAGNFQLPFWIQNAKILNQRNELDISLFPPKLMNDIINDYLPTRIYNLSVNSWVPCRMTHMSQWAGSIDKITWENDVLFIISVGNLAKSGTRVKPGIKDFILNGLIYPEYLLTENFCRIANPSQSCFSLSVGSVTIGEFEDADRISFAKSKNLTLGPSPFSRSGFGIWGMVKPEVVEFAGDLVRERSANPNIIEHKDTSPHLVKSTGTSTESTGRDRVGTSFAAPKISSLVASIQRAFPDENCLFYRGLVVQSARLPEYAFQHPDYNYLRLFGYGVPTLERAINTKQNRITLFSNGTLNAKHADIYSVLIPEGINRPGNEFDILIEVTLSYKANPRRTRMRTNSYLSHWLDWRSSKIGESLDAFTERIVNLKDEDNEDDEDDDNIVETLPGNNIRYDEMPWKIRERSNLGEYKNVKRQDNTIQKDWLIMRSYNIPNEIAIAVMGHKGWSVDLEDKIPYTLFVSFQYLNSENDIYTPIKVHNEIDIAVRVEV